MLGPVREVTLVNCFVLCARCDNRTEFTGVVQRWHLSFYTVCTLSSPSRSGKCLQQLPLLNCSSTYVGCEEKVNGTGIGGV